MDCMARMALIHTHMCWCTMIEMWWWILSLVNAQENIGALLRQTANNLMYELFHLWGNSLHLLFIFVLLLCWTRRWQRGLSGLEITAGQRTMSGLIGELTSQLFVLPVMLTGHNRSYWKWNQLIWNPGWNTTRNVVYNLRIETDIGVHALSVTKLRIFSLLWVKQHRASDRSRRKKSSFAGFSERFAKKSADISGISWKFSALTSPKNNR